MMWAIAAGVGPVLGGTFAQLVSWRWIFWIDLPVSGTSFLLLLMYLDVHNPRTRFRDGAKAIDWAGSLSILGLVISLLLGLNFGGVTLPWDSPTVICLIVFGSLLSIVFAFSELKLAQYPLMPLRLFANKANVACLLVTFTQSFVRTLEILKSVKILKSSNTRYRRLFWRTNIIYHCSSRPLGERHQYTPESSCCRSRSWQPSEALPLVSLSTRQVDTLSLFGQAWPCSP